MRYVQGYVFFFLFPFLSCSLFPLAISRKRVAKANLSLRTALANVHTGTYPIFSFQFQVLSFCSSHLQSLPFPGTIEFMVVRDQPVSAPMHALASGLPASRVEAVALAHREASPEKTQANGLRFLLLSSQRFRQRKFDTCKQRTADFHNIG